jgi:hypothetical protein
MGYDLECTYCGRKNFSTTRALSQHQRKNEVCAQKAKDDLFCRKINPTASHGFVAFSDISRQKSRKEVAKQQSISAVLDRARVYALDKNQIPIDQLEYDEEAYGNGGVEWDDDSEGNMVPFGADEDNEEFGNEDDSIGSQWQPIDRIRANFRNYVEQYDQNFLPYLTKNEQTALQLLLILRKTKASLGTYEDVMRWHLLHSGKIAEHQSSSDYRGYISRKRIFAQLKERYNFDDDKYNIVKEITLPSSKAKAKIVLNDAEAAIQSLLTDPRIHDSDYLFWGNDPFSAPPANINTLSDINSGLSYTETYKKLITRPQNQVLLPVLFYIDGAATGQFANLNITAVKFSLGIFKRKSRDKDHFWRILGYVPDVSPSKTRGKCMYAESGHADASIEAINMNNRSEGETTNISAVPAQDFHTMLAVILDTFLPIQQRGFYWDLQYNGEVYKNIEFVPYVSFICCDTDEADRLCGSYTSRAGGVSQLCRYCQCPTSESDDPTANYAPKTVPLISRLIDDQDKPALKGLSQQYIKNATYLLRFGQHNSAGVHGATPMEMLHHVLLGIFMYVRDMFFEQTGKTSLLSDEINALCIKYGELFGRQSERDMPDTQFSYGIRRGKITAKEYGGVMLVLVAALRSTKGKLLLTDRNNGHQNTLFAQNGHLRDWILLIETLLQWESWLKSDEMLRSDVEKAKHKHRYIMYLIKKVGNRVKGMGLKITKFHAIMHMAQDILHFGVPMNYDTGFREMGHKPIIADSKRTQKKEETFLYQVGNRVNEAYLLALAEAEMAGNHVRNYYQGHKILEQVCNKSKAIRTGGAHFGVNFNTDKDKYEMHMTTRAEGKDAMKIQQDFVDWLGKLQEKVLAWIPKLVVKATHHRNGIIFRASPHYMGKEWRDWVLIDWGDDGHLPCKIWGFVDLRSLPDENNIKYAGYSNVAPAMYAIVESSTLVDQNSGQTWSEIFVRIRTDVRQMAQGRVTKQKFFLADVEAFLDPIVVIPDLSGPPNAYFWCKNRLQWRIDFIQWLREEAEEIPTDDLD